MANLSEVPQEVEELEEEEECGAGVDRLLDFDHGVRPAPIVHTDDDRSQVGQKGHHVHATPKHGQRNLAVVKDNLADMQLDEVDSEDEEKGLRHDHVVAHVTFHLASRGLRREENLKEDHIGDQVAYERYKEPADNGT